MPATALDATALIYSIERASRRLAEAEQFALVYDFVVWLKTAQRHEIQVPAPALAEFLAFYTDGTQQEEIARILSRGFVIVETDLKALHESAKLWTKAGGAAFRKRMNKDFNISKQCLKTDLLIVATAIAHGATQIIAVDTGVHEVAKVAGLRSLTPAQCEVPPDNSPSGSSLFK